jgi:outer membrane protein assembly factor BamB
MRRIANKRWLIFLGLCAVLGVGLLIGLASVDGNKVSAAREAVTPLAPSANRAPVVALRYFLPMVMNSNSRYDWLQFGFNARHDANNTLEKTITSANVGTLKNLFQVTLPAVADGAPVYLTNVTTISGTRDLVFVTTKQGHIVALDANTGTQVWSKQYGAAGCLINNNLARNETCYTTSSPAIDPNRQYVYSYGLDGYVHKYTVGDGTEITPGGWPQLTSFKRYDEKGSSALSIATASNGNTFLYVTNGGYPGDAGDYQGHVTVINLTDGTQKVFNTVCSNQTVHFVETPGTPDCPAVQTAIWARPGVIYDSDNDKIFMATGNGTFNPSLHYWGDTVFALNPNGSGASSNPIDTYTPVNYQQLQDTDADIGSTAPAILPPSSGKYLHLGMQGGKDAVLRLLNLDNLSGRGATGFTGGEAFSMTLSFGGEILTQPAVWVNPSDNSTWVFVANNSGIDGLQLSIDGSGNPSLVSRWTKSSGTSPIIANGVLYYAHGGSIMARNPTNGTLLWSSNLIGGIHWESPIVANGILYITDESGHLTAYNLP